MATTIATAASPATVLCTVVTHDRASTVLSVPGAAAAVAVLIDKYRLVSARWKPHGVEDNWPYAFIALGVHTHVVWFQPEVYVDPFPTTACGIEFSMLREPLLFDTRAACSIGPCVACRSHWQRYYG